MQEEIQKLSPTAEEGEDRKVEETSEEERQNQKLQRRTEVEKSKTGLAECSRKRRNISGGEGDVPESKHRRTDTS